MMFKYGDKVCFESEFYGRVDDAIVQDFRMSKTFSQRSGFITEYWVTWGELQGAWVMESELRSTII